MYETEGNTAYKAGICKVHLKWEILPCYNRLDLGVGVFFFALSEHKKLPSHPTHSIHFTISKAMDKY